MDKKSNENKVFKLFSRIAKVHTENTEIKVNIDIFYELFTSRECHRCEASTYEAVLMYRKCVATKQMGYYRLASVG